MGLTNLREVWAMTRPLCDAELEWNRQYDELYNAAVAAGQNVELTDENLNWACWLGKDLPNIDAEQRKAQAEHLANYPGDEHVRNEVRKIAAANRQLRQQQWVVGETDITARS